MFENNNFFNIMKSTFKDIFKMVKIYFFIFLFLNKLSILW